MISELPNLPIEHRLGTTFLVKANADITIQYEDDGWNVLPMSAHLGKVLPEPLAYVADGRRTRLVWQPLKLVKRLAVDVCALVVAIATTSAQTSARRGAAYGSGSTRDSTHASRS